MIPTNQPSDPSLQSDTRSVSPLIGIILLIGIIFIGLSLIVGSDAFGLRDSQADVEKDAIERDLITFADTAEPVAFGDRSQAAMEFELDPQGGGTYDINEDVGSITVEIGGSTVYDGNLGSVEYEHKGSTIAYQGGGVWRLDDGESSSVVREPPMTGTFYGSTPSYSIPIIELTGVSATNGNILISHESTSNLYPSRIVPAGDSVTITIESKFVNAWRNVLEDRYRLDSGDYTLDEENNQLEVTFGAGEEISLQATHHRIDVS